MKKYKKIFFDFWDIGEQDVFICQSCQSARATDIHHLHFRSQGGKDEISNLIGICRTCHNLAHESKEFNNKLKEINKKIHNET